MSEKEPTPPPNYDQLLDRAVDLMLAACRAGGNEELTTEAARLTTRATAILARRDDDLLPRALVAEVDRDFRSRLLARFREATVKGAAELVEIRDPQEMEAAVKKLLFTDAAKLT